MPRTLADDLQVIAPDKRIHGEAVADFSAKAFGNYFERHAAIRDVFLGPNHYSFPASRIGLIGEKIVTHFGVFDFQMRVGQARLRTAGIGYVATDPHYRRRGLMAKTARACLAGLRQAGFHFSLLYGLENFYEQFGYTRAWSSTDYVASLDRLPTGGPAPRLKTLPCRHSESIDRLYNRHHARIAGSVVRPTYRVWTAGSNFQLFGWDDARRRPAGYIVVQQHGGRLDVVEAAGESSPVIATVAAVAHKSACREIRFLLLAHQTPLAQALRRANVQVHIDYLRNGGPVGRVIDLPKALELLTPEFSRRLSHAGLSKYRGNLLIADRQDAATLLIDRGHVRLGPATATPHRLKAGWEISQLILGTDEPEEIIAAARMQVTGDARFLVPAIFPQQHPMLGALERF